MRSRLLVKVPIGVMLLTPLLLSAELNVSSDFPGGSARVEAIDEEHRVIRILPAEGPGWDSWWYVRVDGIRPGEEITLDVGGGIWATPDRAVWRTGDGEWRLTGNGARAGSRVVYRQKVDAESAWFAWGEPFLLEDAAALVERVAEESPHATAFELARTPEGRPVPALWISAGGEGEKSGIWIQARQHAWEAGSSWVCLGLVEWLVSDDPRAERLRRKAVIGVVPVMDVDNVERGAGGKDQDPHDHNRDWTDDPHWPEVRAAQGRIREMVEAGDFRLMVDLHNPHPRERDIYFFVPPQEWMTAAQRENLAAFLAHFQEEANDAALPFLGRTRPMAVETTARSWVIRSASGDVVAATMETPWNSPESTSENYREAGRRLGLAIARYVAGENER